MPILLRAAYKKMPEHPGVYLMRGSQNKLLYVGKAVNLRRRVRSYFERPQETRIAQMVAQIKRVEYRPTDTAIEALVLEAALIKKNQPPYNVREKDDKSFLHVVITREDFPRVLLVRGKELEESRGVHKSYAMYKTYGSYGPFTSGAAIREALRITRKMFPFSTHSQKEIEVFQNKKRACFDYSIGLCPGTCVGAIGKKDYRKIVRDLQDFFEGRKQRIVKRYEKEMKLAAKQLEFERAAILRKKIFALKHIQDVSIIKESSSTTFHIPPARLTTRSVAGRHSTFRIEGYDISNISGTSAVGSMVVFEDGEPNKNEYRKFKIKTVEGANDPAMLTEVLRRRFKHSEWRMPNLILVDGGVPQVNAAKKILRELKIGVPLIGIAKGPERKRNDIFGLIPAGVDRNTLVQVRDEAHRFAIGYHRKVRSVKSFD